MLYLFVYVLVMFAPIIAAFALIKDENLFLMAIVVSFFWPVGIPIAVFFVALFWCILLHEKIHQEQKK